jgi:ligand-binding SRPBCC domain-containing protein
VTFVPAPRERVFDLARDLDFHQRSLAHTGERIVGGRNGGLIELGEEVEWEARHFGLRLRLRVRITEMDRPNAFVDTQVRGPFVSMTHRHEFRDAPGGTEMIDAWTHRAPLGALVDPILSRYMERLLRTRNAALVAALSESPTRPD